MTIGLSSVIVRSDRRLRLVFSQTLASGAFGVSPTFYTVTCTDGRGVSPLVVAAMAVSGSPAVVDLALGSSLVTGSSYTVSAVAVPAADLSVTPGGTLERFRYGVVDVLKNAEPIVSNRALLLYGTDFIWNGVDFQETPTGDLDRVKGTANVTMALYRATETKGLPWDRNWGVDAREYVDSPTGAIGTLKGALSSQLLRDPRVRSVNISIDIQTDKTYVFVKPTLISGESISPVSLSFANV